MGQNKTVHGTKNQPKETTIFILGVRVDNVIRPTARAMVEAFAANRNGFPPRKVFFTNVHSIQSARHDRELMSCINSADLVLPDGSGLKIAGKVFKTPILENLNGTDFTPEVLQSAESHNLTVYLLGALPNVVDGCLDHLLKQYPNLQIVGYHHGHFTKEEEQEIIKDINAVRPDILLVAFGTPLQEKWITHHAKRLNVGVCLAVGGLFEFFSGVVARAPLWMRRLGLEWVYRFLQDPITKWNRVFVEIPLFLVSVFVRRIIPRSVQSMINRRV